MRCRPKTSPYSVTGSVRVRMPWASAGVGSEAWSIIIWVCAGSFLKPFESFAIERWVVDATMESQRRPQTSVRFAVA
jgi:hypothetical protein